MKKLHPMLTQPNGVTCGPTCLQSIYAFYQDNISLEEITKQTEVLDTGGTLAVLLGNHALKRGYQVTLHSFNVFVLDPTWFGKANISLIQKLKTQAKLNQNSKIVYTSQAYAQFLELGGKIIFKDLSFKLIANYLDKKIPLISGINSTYFYQSMRDYTNNEDMVVYDEFAGEASGHFIVLYAADEQQNLSIADPYIKHNLAKGNHYMISYNHWLHAMLLGIITFDAEVLVISPT